MKSTVLAVSLVPLCTSARPSAFLRRKDRQNNWWLRRQLELKPMWRDDLSALAQEVIAQPADVIERMKQIMGN